jgi:hypothetical protein
VSAHFFFFSYWCKVIVAIGKEMKNSDAAQFLLQSHTQPQPQAIFSLAYQINYYVEL